MATPSTSTLDNFTRANGALGSNWGIADPGITESTIVSDLMTGVTNTNSTAGWIASTFSANQECWATGYTNLGGTDLYVRTTNFNNSTLAGYKLSLDQGGGRIALWTLVNNFFTTNVSGNITGLTGVTGSWINVVGNTFTGYVQTGGAWSQVFQVTDATYTGSGSIGVDTDSGVTPVTVSTFGGGAIVAAVVIPTVSQVSNYSMGGY